VRGCMNAQQRTLSGMRVLESPPTSPTIHRGQRGFLLYYWKFAEREVGKNGSVDIISTQEEQDLSNLKLGKTMWERKEMTQDTVILGQVIISVKPKGKPRC
jgi:hypothetical protein